MAGNYYKYRSYYDPISGGYAGEETGVIPNDTSWVTVDPVNPETAYRQTAKYYFRDSHARDNNQSSRVVVEVATVWYSQFGTGATANRLEIRMETNKIISIVRDDIRGDPSSGAGEKTRNIYYGLSANGPWTPIVLNDGINTAHTIATDINLLKDPSSGDILYIQPGNNTLSSVYIKNCIPGHENDPLPNEYSDIMGIGTQYLNPMPVDYRPGEVWGGSNWLSTNRSSGKCEVWSGTGWTEMRTLNYPTGRGNPPELYRGGWYNQAKLGQE